MSDSKNRTAAQNIIASLLNLKNVSNQTIVNFLRDHDLGYRSQNMFIDINRQRLERIQAEKVPSLGPAEAVPEALMKTKRGRVEIAKYHVVVEGTYTQKDVKGLITRSRTLLFDSAPSQNDVYAALENEADRYEDLYGQVLVRATKFEYFKVVKRT